MKTRGRKNIAIILATCFTFIFGMIGFSVNSGSAADKVYRLKIQSLFPRGDISMETLNVFAESAAQNSNDRLKIKIFAEPEIVPGDQLFEATRQGVVDMLQGMGGMWGGTVPIGYIEFNLPLAFRIPEATTFEKGSGRTGFLRKEWFHGSPPEGIRQAGYVSLGYPYLRSGSVCFVHQTDHKL